MIIYKNTKGYPTAINGNKIAILTNYMDMVISFTKDGRIMYIDPDFMVTTNVIFVEDNTKLLEVKMFPRDDYDKENPILILRFAVEKNANHMRFFD